MISEQVQFPEDDRVARFRLLAGQHVESDRDRPVLDADGRPIPGRFHKRVYKAGDVVESDADLVARHGNQHFELLGEGDAQTRLIAELEAEIAELKRQVAARTPGDVTALNAAEPVRAPGGQISTGLPDGLDAASEATLRRIAADEEIDVDGLTGRDSLLQAIRLGRCSVPRTTAGTRGTAAGGARPGAGEEVRWDVPRPKTRSPPETTPMTEAIETVQEASGEHPCTAATPQATEEPAKAAALNAALAKVALCRCVPGLSWEDAGKLAQQLAALGGNASAEELSAVLGACGGRS